MTAPRPMDSRTIVVTATEVAPEGVPSNVARAMAVTALYFGAVELRTRQCPDCGTYVVVDEEPGQLTAYLHCPPTCPNAGGLTSMFPNGRIL